MRAFFIAQIAENLFFSDVFSENLLTSITKCGKIILHLNGDGKTQFIAVKPDF